jgi:hypothetical protein
MEAGARSRFAPHAPVAVGALVVAMGLAFMLHQAFALQIHYYDTFDYLNDARRLLGDESASYYRVHAPLGPLLAMPVASAILSTAEVDDPLRWVLPHLLGALLAALTLLAVWGWLRSRVGGRWALLGVLLLMGTSLFVRYAPFLLVDIATAGWVAAAFLAWARATSPRGRWFHYGAFGVAIAGGMLTKYSVIVLPLPFVAAELVRVVVERRLCWRRLLGGLFGGCVAALVFWGVMSAVFGYVDGRPFTLETLEALLAGSSAAVVSFPGETWADYAPMLVACVSPITLALAALGVATGLRRSWRRDLPVLLWILLLGGLLSFRIGHNEARYLWPILPAIAYFAVIGARASWGMLHSLARGRGRVAVALLSLAVMGLALTPGISQARRDTHPFFYTGTQPAFVRFIEDHTSGDRSVFWAGHFVALSPPSPNAAVPEDEFFDFFHLGHPCVHLLTSGRVVGVPSPGDPARFLRGRPGEGDVLVVGPPSFVFGPGAAAPETFEVYARRRLSLRREGSAYVDDDGRAWLRVVGSELEAVTELGECDLSAVPVGGDAIPLGRHVLGPGARFTPGPALEGEAPLSVVSVVRRVFPASWRE